MLVVSCSMAGVEEGEAFEHDRFAVSDGPSSTDLIAVPSARAAAAELRARLRGNFWCSRVAGGCGARLTLKVGEVRRPHFAHRPGEATGCASVLDAGRLRDAYLHMAIQQGIEAWLANLGVPVTLEYRIPGGRLDVYAMTPFGAHDIEIQRSPLAQDDWLRRTELYRGHCRTVDWLWAEQRRSEAELDLHTHGRAHLVRLRPDLRVDVGTAWLDEHGHLDSGWDDLNDCGLGPNGLHTPHSNLAAAFMDQWQRAESDKRHAAEEEVRRRAEVDERWRREAAQMRAAAEQRAARLQTEASHFASAQRYAPAPAARPQGRARGRLLACRREDFPEVEVWEPARGWDWLAELPAELHESARHLAFAVCRLAARGPRTDLAWDDAPDPQRLQEQVLARIGYISLTEDGLRWVRGEDAWA